MWLIVFMFCCAFCFSFVFCFTFCCPNWLQIFHCIIGFHRSVSTTQLLLKSFVDTLKNSCTNSRYQNSRGWIQLGLVSCKNNLYVMFKGDTSDDFQWNFLKIWQSIGSWKVIPFEKDFYELSFVSSVDLQSVGTIETWNMKLSLICVFFWTNDFI